jgi:hypothetical protein
MPGKGFGPCWAIAGYVIGRWSGGGCLWLAGPGTRPRVKSNKNREESGVGRDMKKKLGRRGIGPRGLGSRNPI